MSQTVQHLLAELARDVDPRTSDQVIIDETNVGTVDGVFTAQRLLGLYNNARLAIGSVLYRTIGRRGMPLPVSGAITPKEDFQFQNGTASLPPDYIYTILLTDAAGLRIVVISADSIESVRSYENAERRFVIEENGALRTLSGVTYVPDASTYVLRYFSIPIYTLSDVTGGVVNESYNDLFHPLIIQVAALLANERGSVEVANLVRRFFASTAGGQ